MALDRRIHRRVTPERKRLIEAAAKASGVTVSEFIRRAASDAVRQHMDCED